MDNKFITFFVLVSILFFAASYARADQYSSIVYTPIYTIDPAISIENPKNYTGVASAIAMGQINFDWSTQKKQVSIGYGNFSGQDAVSIGFGKRFDKTLINISVGREGNKSSYGAGFGFRF